MDAVSIDHVNLRIPANGIPQALEFYRDVLGFEIERRDEFKADEKPFIAVRLTETSVIHLWPDPNFESPNGWNYDHISIHLEESGEAIRETIEDAAVPIEDDRMVAGAVGHERAIYVRDPFGYLVELKAAHT
jgi:catechol 2,3-dioxygenase-like lactoylglutathione lyase family enzyme